MLGQETPADGIRLKNLVRQAEEGLVERGLRRPDAQAMLKPARRPHRRVAAVAGRRFRASPLFLSEDGARALPPAAPRSRTS